MNEVSFRVSEITTKSYSTSFSMGISLLDKPLHNAIYSIYGFVRFTDEIVDTFGDFNQEKLLNDFEKNTWEAIALKFSLNPILNSFQWVVNRFNIDHELIGSFLHSMRMDLCKKNYDQDSYKEYIWGSAEVIGLMCLSVFLDGNKEEYLKLKPYAISLGSAFQKINFLRDLAYDENELGRIYFPQLGNNSFNETNKQDIVQEIEEDLQNALIGIKMLPISSRHGVNSAYEYYRGLLKKIKRTGASELKSKRVRISNLHKFFLTCVSYLKIKGLIAMSLVLFYAFSSIPAFANSTLSELRSSFINCHSSKTNALLFIEKSNLSLKENPESYINKAYSAAGVMLSAKYGLNPIRKLNAFKEGRNSLEQVLADKKNNLELRFIRYANQYLAPVFLNYRDNLNQDLDYIVSALKTSQDPELKNLVKRFLVEITGEFTWRDFDD